MIRYAKGFSLIECLVYCVIASILSIMVFTFFNQTITKIHIFSVQEQEIVGQWSAQQLLRKDIQMANSQLSDWDILEKAFVCKIGTRCVGWQLKNGSLYRFKGDYDFLSHQWQKKSTALVIRNLHDFALAIQQNQRLIEAITYTLQFNKVAINKKVFFMNGLGCMV